MVCALCGSKEVATFSANQAASRGLTDPGDLPVACLDCRQMTIRGKAIDVAMISDRQVTDLSARAQEKGRESISELEEEGQEVSIEKYFARVYTAAYLDGFMRCLAFTRANPREGRIKRLRELWTSAMKDCSESAAYAIFDSEAFKEFERLITMGPVRD